MSKGITRERNGYLLQNLYLVDRGLAKLIT